jgi:hypothetical protein
MVRIPAHQRDDGRFEAEGIAFDPPMSASGTLGPAVANAILGTIFARIMAQATTPKRQAILAKAARPPA